MSILDTVIFTYTKGILLLVKHTSITLFLATTCIVATLFNDWVLMYYLALYIHLEARVVKVFKLFLKLPSTSI